MVVNKMRNGAYDFVEKAFNNDHLVDTVKKEMDKGTFKTREQATEQRACYWGMY